MVQHEGLIDKLTVTADGTGQVAHTGSALLAGLADKVGLTSALSEAMAPTRRRRSAHDPGVVLRDLIVTLADGGDCLADLGTLRDQECLFGAVASDATAFRVISSIDESGLERLREALASARRRAWAQGARDKRKARSAKQLTIIDIDATLIASASAKEQAAGTFKGGFGHHPLVSYLDGSGEALSGILRAGNAGSNTASDHKEVLDLALGQLDERALDGEILLRADGAGATHELTVYCRDANMRFSVGFDLDERVRCAIATMPADAWIAAIRADGSRRRDSQVAELSADVDLSTWPEGSRLFARRTKLKASEQASFADEDGYRFSIFLTDQGAEDIRALDLTHREHAHVEDRIREAKDCGLANLPFRSFAANQVWLWAVQAAQDLVAWAKALCLNDEGRRWELKRIRYRLLHQGGRIAHHARRRILRLAGAWPWAKLLAAAFKRLRALPAPGG